MVNRSFIVTISYFAIMTFYSQASKKCFMGGGGKYKNAPVLLVLKEGSSKKIKFRTYSFYLT